jgi:hypothetical protein
MDIERCDILYISFWTIKMIVSTYEEGIRTANVCKQSKDWVVMTYENAEHLKTILARNEEDAEIIAEDWVLKVDSQ